MSNLTACDSRAFYTPGAAGTTESNR